MFGGGDISVSGKVDDAVKGRDAANGMDAVNLGREDLGLELEKLGSGLAWFDEEGRNTSARGFGPG